MLDKSYNQLIKKAKNFFNSNQFVNSRETLLYILKHFNLDLKIKSNLYLLLSDVNTKLNNLNESNSYLLSYLELNENNSRVPNLLANNYSLMGQYKKAEKYYLKAINSNNDNVVAIINLAILFDNLGKKSKALNLYKKVIKLDPNNLGVLFNMYKLEKNILNDEKVILIKKYLNSDNQNFFNIASGYFLLAEHEKKKKISPKKLLF